MITTESESRIASSVRAMQDAKARRAAAKLQKEAERKAFWDHYYDQLGKATPFEDGGAKRRRANGRIFRWN